MLIKYIKEYDCAVFVHVRIAEGGKKEGRLLIHSNNSEWMALVAFTRSYKLEHPKNIIKQITKENQIVSRFDNVVNQPNELFVVRFSEAELKDIATWAKSDDFTTSVTEEISLEEIRGTTIESSIVNQIRQMRDLREILMRKRDARAKSIDEIFSL